MNILLDMKNNIYINKKGLLRINPIWVSLNKGKYKLYCSNPIQLSTDQKENVIEIREVFFIHSKKIDVHIEDTSISLNIQITSLDRWLRIGIVIVSLSIMLYLMTPWRFFPTQVLFYILFGYMGVAVLLLLIFKRKNFFKVQY